MLRSVIIYAIGNVMGGMTTHCPPQKSAATKSKQYRINNKLKFFIKINNLHFVAQLNWLSFNRMERCYI